MSLRLRLLLMIGVSLTLLWSGLSVWMLRSLDDEVHRTLDQRLAMSTEMVARLIAQNPAVWNGHHTDKAGKPLLKLLPPLKSIDCRITSMRGEIIARTPGALPDAMLATTPGFSERIINGERWRSYTYETGEFRITTADRLNEREALLHNVMMSAALPFIVATIGGLAVLWFGVKSGLRPLKRLQQALAGRTAQTMTPVPVTAMSRDLLPLVDTLNQLFRRMDMAIGRERRFTSAAAHELRTPLTAVKTHLQVARITQGDQAALAMDYAEEGVARLQHTLSQLLTLSRIEGPFSWDEGAGQGTDPVEIAQLAMRDAAADAPGRITFEHNGDSRRIALPRALAVTALRNLLDNALRHSPSTHSVELTLQSTENASVFSVRDRGPGLAAHELEAATQRFWRRSPGEGSGLGLSIVVAITERFGGDLTLARRAGGGLMANLILPVVGNAVTHLG